MSKVDLSTCIFILDRGLRNSWHYFNSGRQSQAYVNIDNALLGEGLETDTAVPQYSVMESLAEQFTVKIQEIEQENPFDRLAFIDKAGHGPVGMIALSSQITCKSQKEAIFVRPYKNTVRSTIEGKPMGPGERILIVSDVATTGQSLLKAASKLWAVGTVVVGALVFLDQELGAKENLSLKDVSLYSLLTRSKGRESLELPERLPDTQIESLRVFGGAM